MRTITIALGQYLPEDDPERNAATICRMLRDAAAEAGVELKEIEIKKQSPDHPIVWGLDESNYLKFYIFQVCEEK